MDDVVAVLEVKKDDDCFVDVWWNARMGALLRKADFVSSGSFVARRAGPWRTVMVKDMALEVCPRSSLSVTGDMGNKRELTKTMSRGCWGGTR